MRRLAWLRALALPVLVATAHVFFLWGENAASVSPGDGFVPLAITVGLTIVAFLVTAALVRDPPRAALTVTTLVVLVLSFGYRVDGLAEVLHVDWGALRWSLLGADVLVFGVVVLAVRRVRGGVGGIVNGLLLVTAIFIGLSVPRLASSFVALLDARAEEPANRTSSASGPDIYYIVLDGYARNDVLADIFGFDNEPFLEWLENRGFYVARESLANYTRTHLSLASSLNMRYVDELPPNLTPDAGRELRKLLQRPRAIRALIERGYTYVHFDTPWWGTSGTPLAEVRYGLDQTSEFEAVYLQTTMPGRLLPLPTWQEEHLQTLSHLPDVALKRESTIAFAHVLFPHPPFVLDEDGEVLERDVELGGSWDDRDGYVRQLRFMNRWLASTVDAILATSPDQPLIVIQSDHGPWSTAGVTHDPGLARWERTAILNAYLVPDRMRASLYPSITPVNTFRLVLRDLLDLPLSLLADRSMFSPSDTEPRIDVTEELQDR